ncbi:aminotransferase class V-fold PLP-dependent enzyme [Galbibacter sp. PAP.153]|uniref:aminotransferase class V-fold PLP-dependent enzyme n=1 Tax=Galbibacter sp. PAP.153 TaxID=3104623 RepID=UPI003008CDA8
MTIEQFSKGFPVINQYTYVNTAASGLMYESLMEWRQEHDIDFLIGGSRFRESAGEQIEDIRAQVASFFNASNPNTVLTPNFSFALKTFVNGIDKNQNILLLEDDYPSLNWPFVSSGFKNVSYVTVNPDMEENIREAFKKLKPDIFAFSVVQYLSGIKIDLKFIKSLKKEYPEVLFIADGTQYSGMFDFSFKDSGIDIYGGSGYKWLLSGYGNGYMLFGDAIKDKIYPKSFEFEPQKEPFLQGVNHIRAHFEPGHLDTLNFGSLAFSLQLFNEVGIATIEKHTKSISAYAMQKFKELNLLTETVAGQKEHSSIFNLQIDKKKQAALKSRNVTFSLRGSGARVSFHLYNTKADIDKIASILKH